MSISHYIITRINLGVYSPIGVSKRIRKGGVKKISDIELMESRNSFTLGTIWWLKQASIPSIMYQTNKNFKWIWLVDKETPEEIKMQLISLSQLYHADVIFDTWRSRKCFSEKNSCGGDWVVQFKSKIRDDIIACTRYDIDDYLSSNFVQVVQSYFDNSIGCIDFEFRISIDRRNNLYVTKNLSYGNPSPITTVVEKKEDMRTPYYTAHYHLNEHYSHRCYPDIVFAKSEKTNKEIIISNVRGNKLQDVKNFENFKPIS